MDKVFYEPGDQGAEKKIRERVEFWRAQFARARSGAGGKASSNAEGEPDR